jgi:acyl-coenzyme A synthetase/AMP-(fatty) acid ligase
VEAWHWYNKVVGKEKCVVVDTWWQTETGGICISPTPSAPGSEILPGMPMRPMYGIWPAILGEKVMSNVYLFSKFILILIGNLFCKGGGVERQ